MVSKKRKFGDIGEKIAGEYLTQKGYTIIEKNYLKPWGEIDIIVKKGDKIIFFEVKTRDLKNTGNFLPEQSINSSKMRKLQRVCETYLVEKNLPDDQEWQIDILAVSFEKSSGRTDIKHFENAVWESRY